MVAIFAPSCRSQTTWRAAQPRASTQPAQAAEAWGRDLRDHVKNGRPRYFGLAADSRGLEHYMSWLGSHGPNASPTEFSGPDQRLAYRLNARQASVIWAGLAYHRARQKLSPKERDGVIPRPPFEALVFRIDGQDMMLSDMAAKAWELRPDDIRLAAALPDGSQAGPPFLAELFDPERLECQLETQWQTVMTDPELTRIDHEKRRLLVLPAIYERRDELVAAYRRQLGTDRGDLLSALLWRADADARRWLNRALGYTIGTLPRSHGLRQRVEPWDSEP